MDYFSEVTEKLSPSLPQQIKIGKNYYNYTEIKSEEGGKYFISQIFHSLSSGQTCIWQRNDDYYLHIGNNIYAMGKSFILEMSMEILEGNISSDFKTLKEVDIIYETHPDYRKFIGIISLDKDEYIPTSYGKNIKRALSCSRK